MCDRDKAERQQSVNLTVVTFEHGQMFGHRAGVATFHGTRQSRHGTLFCDVRHVAKHQRGQQLVRRMEQSGQYNIVGWYDEDYREYRRCCMNVDPMSDISDCRFDYILIAKLDRASVNAYRSELLDLGISHEKILAIEPSKEARRQALDIYLNEDAGGNSD